MLLGLSTPWPRADRRSRGHDARRARFLDLRRHDRVVAGVAQDLEAVLNELARRFERADGVGQQRLLIVEHFELDPVLAGVVQLVQQFPAQAGDAHRVLRGEAACGVGQDRIPVGVDEVQERLAFLVDEAFAADGDGDNLGPRSVQAGLHRGVIGVLAGADDQAGLPGPAGEGQGGV